mmetsp:Transcript_125884/g.350746  ORF Transcript_125884/g.350746 Transcript_125884/m.350746 type:complete len:345 (+) Transcript_125884:67-1101(+)
MSGIKQPVNQKRLTNVAVVRLKSHGKRFEIACYKNKVLNWREGIEKDLSEVIQIDTIFTNVSKGVVANEKDLQKVFGTTENEDICRRILKSGDLQVSDKEREVHLEGLFRDIVQIVVERCVHPQTGRQLTALTVDNALRAIGFSVQPDHAAKKQALKAIEALCTELPESFARAKMRLRISCPEALLGEVREHLVSEAHAHIEEEAGRGADGPCTLTFLCEPSQYRGLDRLATSERAGGGVSLQVVTAAVLGEAEAPAVLTALQAPACGRGPMGAMAAETPERGAGPRCSTCSAAFADAQEYRHHCRGEWHTFNLKRKVKGLGPVSEEEFAEISLDVREGFLAVE